MPERLAFALVFSSIALGSAHAVAADAPCSSGWFGARAHIVRIDPAGKVAKRISSQGTETDAAVDAVLCAGDTLVAPAGVGAVEYYENGRSVQLASGQAHKVPSNVESATAKASEYVRLAMGAVGALSTPSARPAPTASRGSASHSEVASLKAILPLRDLPRQRLTPDMAVLVGWRDGATPYRCEVLDDSAGSAWRGPEVQGSWCLYPPEAQRAAAARLVVRDAARRTVGWNIAPVAWADVPRPDWIDARATARMQNADFVAWGVWLWNSGSSEWRLQSLAMLNAASSEHWLAGYVVENVLAETPPVLAK